MKLRDYKEDLIFNGSKDNSFAIELEIGVSFFNKVIKKLHFDKNNESRNIKELIDLHLRDSETISTVYNKCKEYYKDKFPLGEDCYISGGVHFHIFGNFGELRKYHNNIEQLLINCPFFMKLHEGKMYNRYNSHHEFHSRVRLGENSKYRAITLNAVGSFEFRCNNVIDGRLLGYYQGILLAAKKGVTFEKVSEAVVRYAKVGDDETHAEESYDYPSFLKGTKEENKITDIAIKDCNGVTISKDDRNIILRNVGKIVSLLKEEGLVNSSRAFGEYIDEFNF